MTLKDKRIEWKARYDTWKESGQTIAEWCRNQKSKSTKCIIGCSDLKTIGFLPNRNQHNGLPSRWTMNPYPLKDRVLSLFILTPFRSAVFMAE